MSYEALIFFKSGRCYGERAPRAADPAGRSTFGRNFPRLLDVMDRSARELGVKEPSRFIWHDPMMDEGELDKLSAEEFAALNKRHHATIFWVPLRTGIQTFEALARRHELDPESGPPTEAERYLAFEVACFAAALKEAVADGEYGFNIQCG